MTPEQFIKAELAALAYREAAHHGGVNNMLAVAFVVRNRWQAGWCGGDWMELITHHEEYNGTIPPPIAMNLRNVQFRMLLAMVDDVYSGLATDAMTEGALYYAELNHIDRPWFKTHVLADPKQHKRVASVGNVNFFL